jgi:hypothetical protein
MFQLFTIGKNGHYIEFRVPRTLAMNLVVKYEVDTWMGYETRDVANNTPLTTTLVPLVIKNSDPLPMFCIETTNNFFLRDSKIIMVPEVLGHDWSSFSEIEAESQRIHETPLLRELLERSPTSVVPKISDVDEAQAMLLPVGPFACGVTSAAACCSSSIGGPPASKMPRPF